MGTITVGHIVEFNDKATHLAAIFCREHGLAGKVVSESCGVVELDVGLYYNVYAQPGQIDFVAESGEITKVPEELASKAPLPDDVGN